MIFGREFSLSTLTRSLFYLLFYIHFFIHAVLLLLLLLLLLFTRGTVGRRLSCIVNDRGLGCLSVSRTRRTKRILFFLLSLCSRESRLTFGYFTHFLARNFCFKSTNSKHRQTTRTDAFVSRSKTAFARDEEVALKTLAQALRVLSLSVSLSEWCESKARRCVSRPRKTRVVFLFSKASKR